MKQRSGCWDCARYSLVILHILFLVFGLLILFLGVWIFTANKNVMDISTSEQMEKRLYQACFLLIGTGSFLSIISIVGCIGTINCDQCILVFIMVIDVVLVILEIALAALGILFQDQITQQITTELSNSLVLFKGDNFTDPISIGWKEVQTAFSCCGVNTPVGYENHTNVNGTGSLWYLKEGEPQGKDYPGSCCRDVNNCYIENPELLSLNKKGCLDELIAFFRQHLLLMSLVAVFLVILQIFTVVISYKICKSIGRTGLKNI